MKLIGIKNGILKSFWNSMTLVSLYFSRLNIEAREIPVPQKIFTEHLYEIFLIFLT